MYQAFSCSYVNMNFGSVRSVRVNFCGGLILETNCIFEYTPSPHFRLDVVYKMGGRINGTLRYVCLLNTEKAVEEWLINNKSHQEYCLHQYHHTLGQANVDLTPITHDPHCPHMPCCIWYNRLFHYPDLHINLIFMVYIYFMYLIFMVLL